MKSPAKGLKVVGFAKLTAHPVNNTEHLSRTFKTRVEASTSRPPYIEVNERRINFINRGVVPIYGSGK